MTQINNIEKKRIMVERMGIFFEKRGLTPVHGRVFAFLLLAEPPHKDFNAIHEFTQASRSTVNNALRKLMSENLVDYKTFSGDRKRYFQINVNGWIEATKLKIQDVVTLKDIVENALKERDKTKHKEFNQQLQQLIQFHEELAITLDNFIKKWNQIKVY